jgi:predicted PurR-regulated permease PerM
MASESRHFEKATQPEAGPQPVVSGQDSAISSQLRVARMLAASLGVITTIILLTVIYYAKLPLIVLLVSIFLAFMLAPLVDLLERIRLPRAVAALLAVLLFAGAIYGCFYLGYSRAQDFLQKLPQYSGEIRKIVTHVRQKTQKIEETTQNVLPEATASDKNTVRVEEASPWWQPMLGTSLGSVTEILFIASFIPFLVYFMLSWQEHARASTVKLFRPENRHTAYVTLGLISSMIRSFIVGNVVIGLIISAVSTAVFGLLGLPYFYFVGTISGYLSLVPYLGVLLALVPPLLTGTGHLHGSGLIVIVVTVFGMHLFALNVLYPKLLGSRVQLNPLAVMLTLLFWGWLWGTMGLVLAIPIMAAVKIVCDHIERLRAYGAWLGE